ncbi:hypothetical protein Scep_014451 [Stephania cephalantha]|uniref:Uncharacterized protein n=1 Tax=Stephania cephalantha TaxID=152367 RepID=A0AAP0P1Q3_9MAGN
MDREECNYLPDIFELFLMMSDSQRRQGRMDKTRRYLRYVLRLKFNFLVVFILYILF